MEDFLEIYRNNVKNTAWKNYVCIFLEPNNYYTADQR